MKKLIALVLTFALAIGFGTLAMAASPIEDIGDTDTKNVTATYTPAGPASTVYSVAVAWGAMAFAYTGESNGSWDADTHTYTATSTGAWTGMDDTNNKVTVTNHSNAAVNVELAYAAGGSYTAVTGTLSVTEDTLTAGPEGSPSTADKVDSFLTLSGKPAAAIAAGTVIGTITVTLAS